jgi:hypothetical protein
MGLAALLLPLPAVVALLTLMISALVYGFAGSPARRRRPLLTLLLLGLGLLCLPFAVGALVIRAPELGLLVVCAGVILFALAARLLRAPGGDGGDDEGGGGGGPRRPTDPDEGPGGVPVDWDAFDRERETWSSDHPAGV